VAGRIQMCVINYLASKTAEIQMPRPSVDAIGIKWPGDVASEAAVTEERESQDLPETPRRPLGWK
jgi:hypothetical protein